MAKQFYRVKLTFSEAILGAVAQNKDLYTDYVTSKAAPETDTTDELETLQEVTEKGWTGFHRLPDGTPILYNYVVKGYLKDAISMLRRDTDTASNKMKAYNKVIDGNVFVYPRQIALVLPAGTPTDEKGWPVLEALERPLRAQTAQGPRVALAKSDQCPRGTTIEFIVKTLGDISEAHLRECLEYGEDRGLGQWRNGGYGTFSYELHTLSEPPVIAGAS